MARYKVTGRVTYDFTVFVVVENENQLSDRLDPLDGELELVGEPDVENVVLVDA